MRTPIAGNHAISNTACFDVAINRPNNRKRSHKVAAIALFAIILTVIYRNFFRQPKLTHTYMIAYKLAIVNFGVSHVPSKPVAKVPVARRLLELRLAQVKRPGDARRAQIIAFNPPHRAIDERCRLDRLVVTDSVR